jgi:hypothetical protein
LPVLANGLPKAKKEFLNLSLEDYIGLYKFYGLQDDKLDAKMKEIDTREELAVDLRNFIAGFLCFDLQHKK